MCVEGDFFFKINKRASTFLREMRVYKYVSILMKQTLKVTRKDNLQTTESINYLNPSLPATMPEM